MMAGIQIATTSDAILNHMISSLWLEVLRNFTWKYRADLECISSMTELFSVEKDATESYKRPTGML